ncbi:MAG: esterase [Deltaproteobacteria bacterium]|nr:esterase [Deltaproteobacteria bacterium]
MNRKPKLRAWAAILIIGWLSSVVACAHTRGSDIGTLRHDGLKREYILYRPSARAAPAIERPLLVVLHGGGGTYKHMLRLTSERFNQLAERDGFFVVYPQGIDKSWNDGRGDETSGAHRKGIDDVGFLKTLIEKLIDQYPIDARRVFVTGISNGGLMSYLLACRLPDTIRAIAPVTAQIPSAIAPLCRAESAVSLAVFNGTEDPLVPYKGGQIKVFGRQRGAVLSTDETINIWRKKNRCSPQAKITAFADLADDGTRVTKMEYGPCDKGSKVALYRIDGGGHTWPDGRQYLPVRWIGRTTRDINGCDEIWAFFKSLK